MSNRSKDRELSKADFLDILQKEYFVNEIKYKIYNHKLDRNHYKKVMGYKQEKIENISKVLGGVSTIFNDDETHEQYRSEVYPKMGLPNFDLSPLDYEKYYAEDTDVIVNIEDEKRKIGKLLSVNFDKNIGVVKLRGSADETPYSLKFITRVL